MKNLEGNKRVIFLALSGIGNLIMQLPTIEALKKARPNWRLTVWVAPRGTREIAASQPYIDEVIEMPIQTTVMRHIQNIVALRKQHFDIGIVLSPGQLIKSAAYLQLAGIQIRIGNSYPYRGNPHSTKSLTDTVEEKENLHDIEQNLRLLEPLGITDATAAFYSLHIPNANIEEAKKYGLGGTKYIGIHAGCAKGFEFKRWPLDRFVEVIKALIAKDPTLKILIFGGPDEEAQKKELAEMIGSGSRVQIISASLLTTAAIMQHCKLFISNDSGLMHLAASAGIPVVGIFGPTEERLTGPRGRRNNIVVRATGTKAIYETEKAIELGRSAHETLLAVTPEIVVAKIEEIGLL